MGKNLLLLVASLLSSLAIGEALLRLSTDYPILDSDRPYHPALIYMMPPKMVDIDRHGFRNPDGIGQVDVAAIGDSHTYGYNVDSPESWPVLLAKENGVSVYNYGIPGYGTLQYRWLFEEAISRRPEHILIGLYVGNDLNNYCRDVQQDYWLKAVRELGIEEPACATRKQDAETEEDGRRASLTGRMASFWQATALGNLIEKRVREPLAEYLYESGKGVTVIKYGRHETALALRKVLRHGRSVDLGRESTAEAYAVFQRHLKEMARIAKARNVRFGLLVIPTKENVFFESIDSSDNHFETLKAAVETERAFIRELTGFLRDQGIPATSALRCLQSSSGEPLYPDGIDGHPLAAGYRCYAEAAGALLTPPGHSVRQTD